MSYSVGACVGCGVENSMGFTMSVSQLYNRWPIDISPRCCDGCVLKSLPLQNTFTQGRQISAARTHNKWTLKQCGALSSLPNNNKHFLLETSSASAAGFGPSNFTLATQPIAPPATTTSATAPAPTSRSPRRRCQARWPRTPPTPSGRGSSPAAPAPAPRAQSARCPCCSRIVLLRPSWCLPRRPPRMQSTGYSAAQPRPVQTLFPAARGRCHTHLVNSSFLNQNIIELHSLLRKTIMCIDD